jgi:hypothetical protein
MKLDDMLESKYLKQSDVQDETIVTCVGVKRANMAKEDEEPEYRWIVKWQEFAKPMVINATNIKRLFKYLGDDTDQWKNGQVVLYVDHDIEFGGKVVGGLRVKEYRKATVPAAVKSAAIAKVEAMRKASQPESENPAAGVDDDFDSLPF